MIAGAGIAKRVLLMKIFPKLIDWQPNHTMNDDGIMVSTTMGAALTDMAKTF